MTKRLLDELELYLAGEHANPDAVEEAMFDAPDDEDLRFLDRVRRHGTRLVENFTWDMSCTPEIIETLRGRGHVIQIEERWPGSHLIELGEFDFFVTKLHIGRTDLERVDAEIEIPAMNARKIIRDGLVDQRDGVVYALCERPLALIAFGAGRTYVRIRERDGDRKVIAEYTFNEHLG